MDTNDQPIRLSLIGFNDSQTAIFSAMLDLAERNLKQSWNIVGDGNDADFFVLAMEKNRSEVILSSRHLPDDRCVFCSTQESDEENVLFTDEKKIPRLGSLVKVLNHVISISSFGKEPLATITVFEPNITLAPNNDFFDPARYFLNALINNANSKTVLSFNTPQNPKKLYIDNARRVFYSASTLKDIKPLISPDNAISLDILSDIEWEHSVEEASLTAKPLNTLLWLIGFELSKGRLLLGHSDNDNVGLKNWPDLNIPGCMKYVKLAAFMRNNTTSLMTAADKTNIPLTQVYDFYNACFLIGIIEKTETDKFHTKIVDENKKVLFGKILNRINTININE